MTEKESAKFFSRIFYYLVPPGNGVFRNYRCEYFQKELQQQYFDESEVEKIEKVWKEKLLDFFKNHQKRVFLLAIPSDVGAGVQRGANLGSTFLRLQLVDFFKKRFFGDFGDIKVVPQLLLDEYLNDSVIGKVRKVLYGEKGGTLPVSPLSIADDFAQNLFTVTPYAKLFVLGGDHSVSYPLIKNWLLLKKRYGIKTAVIVFDAHSDLARERLGIEISYTSWAYHLIKFLNKPSDLIQIGLRESSDIGIEKRWGMKNGVTQFWPKKTNWTSSDFEKSLEKTLKYLKDNKVEEIYISLDADVLDSKIASAVENPSSGGLAPFQIFEFMQGLNGEVKITGADLVEVAPFVSNLKKDLTKNDTEQDEPKKTIVAATFLAKELIKLMNKS
jgi:agmatinase